MKNIGLIIVLALIMLLTCCKSNINKTEGPDTVEIFDAFGKKTQVPVSTIADSVEYILLENSPDHFVSYLYDIDVTDSLVILVDFKHIYIFDRYTGRFLREIASFGRGPDEHNGRISYDELGNSFIASLPNSSTKKIIYYLDGRKPSGITFPDDNGAPGDISDVVTLSANRFIGNWLNWRGNNKYKLAVFDTTGQILNQYRNYSFFDNKDRQGMYINNQRCFFRCMDKIRFFENFTDTVYSVNETELVPQYVLNMDILSPPYYLKTVPLTPAYGDKHKRYIEISGIRESSRYLIFTFSYEYYSYMGYFDKKEKTTVVCDEVKDKEYYKIPGSFVVRNIGFENDIDSFMPVGTGKVFYVNSSDKLITYTEAVDVERWFQQNPARAATLPDRLKKFSEVKAEDNYIIQVVHLKK